jgi:hypothetical protein
VTFNHGVEGSSPSALTKEINHLYRNYIFLENPVSALCLQTHCRAALSAVGQHLFCRAPWFSRADCVNRA